MSELTAVYSSSHQVSGFGKPDGELDLYLFRDAPKRLLLGFHFSISMYSARVGMTLMAPLAASCKMVLRFMKSLR
ncbi:hypothetical protein CSQ94_15520 [Janthinobacterium sp. BJB312]|nr:hypothetical protein CSQ94_15520 [Janthinobacterium sp. BJB312]